MRRDEELAALRRVSRLAGTLVRMLRERDMDPMTRRHVAAIELARRRVRLVIVAEPRKART